MVGDDSSNGGGGVASVSALRIVNAMYDMDLGRAIDLSEAYRHLTTTVTGCKCKLYRGRPQMLLVYLPLYRRNIQLFPSGKIQVLGRVFPSDARSMITCVCTHLRPLLLPQPPPPKPMTLTLRNLVIDARLNRRVMISRFPHSAGCRDAFYEPELFPALQINKWLPIHVAVFATGRCVITGLTNPTSTNLSSVLCDLLSFLNSYHLFSD